MTFDLEEARSRVAGLDRPDPAELRGHVEALARPRMTGTEGAAEVTAALRQRFEALGYRAEALPFEFSEWPGRFGLPAAGVVLALTGAIGGRLTATGNPVPALIVLVVGLGLALLPLALLPRALRSFPLRRAEGTNLLFQHPDARPAWIVMAHRDSKSQLLPTALRTASLIVAAATWGALLLIAALWLLGPEFHFPTAATVAAILLTLSGIALTLSWAANASPGALDNASGLAALLAVAERLENRGHVAFLLTEGEELGLAGARAVVGSLPPVQGVINVDGLDDHGPFWVAEGKGWRRTGSAPQLAAALLTAGRALDLPVHRRPLPRSFMVDHLPLAAAGIPSLTLLRGTWSSLMRVHSPRDDVGRLRCTGAAEGAALLTAALHLLRAPGAAHLASRGRPGP